MSTPDTPWLLSTFSLLTATISVIIKPSGHHTFAKDVEDNILSFSPFRSGRGTISLILYFIHLPLSNIAGIHASLKILSYIHFPLEEPLTEHGIWLRFARRAFFIGVTLPLYVTLLALTSHRWLQAFTTSLIAECMLVELLELYWNPLHDVFTVRRDWPRRTMLMVQPSATADRLNRTRFDDEDGTDGSSERKENGNMAPAPALKDNLCDRIQQLRLTGADSDIDFPVHSIPPEYAPKLERIFSLHVRTAKWTCGHWRCAIYMISRVAQRMIMFSWYLEQLLTVWLLQITMHPVTLHAADKMLKNNIIGGLLTMFYQISLMVTLAAFAWISSILLFVRLRKHERIEKAFRDLAERAPIIYRALDIFGKLIMPCVMSFVFTRALFPRDPSLTSKMISYAIDAVVILILCIIGSRLLLSRARSELTSPSEPEIQSDPTPSSEPRMAPKSSDQGPPNLGATTTHQTFSNDTGNGPEGGSKYAYAPVGSGFQIFRLGIWATTSILWIFFPY